MRALVMAILLPWVVLGAQRSAAVHLDTAGLGQRIEFEQHLDRRVPTELVFGDENGRTVHIADYLGNTPVALVFSYFGCSNMCPTVIRNLAERLVQASGGTVSKLQIVVVSIDPLDSPALAALSKRKYLAGDLLPGRAEHWHFLTGAKAAIDPLAEAVGFHYQYDDGSRQYAHPAGFALLTPEGRIARYFFGFDFTANELSHAIDEAAARRIATPLQRLLLVCFHYDPVSGPYNATITTTLQGLGLALLAAVFAVGRKLRWRVPGAANSGR